MNSERLAEIEAVWAKARPCPSGCGCADADAPDRNDCACDGPCCMDDAWFDGHVEARLVAHEHIAELLTHIRGQEAENAALRNLAALVRNYPEGLGWEIETALAALAAHRNSAGAIAECACSPGDDYCTCSYDCECKQRWAHPQALS